MAKAIATIAAVMALYLFAETPAGAQTTAASGPDVAATKPAAGSSVLGTLGPIVRGVGAKLRAKNGNVTAEDLAVEIKAFDELLASHPEKTEETAQVAYMKARLYTEVLKDSKTGGELIKQLKEDYKDTRLVAELIKFDIKREAAEKRQAALAPGVPFPDFDEKDLNGNPLSVGALKGKVVLVDFWATWCGPCVIELPNVIATYKQHHGEGFEIIGISLDVEREQLNDFLKQQQGMSWAQYFDGQEWEGKLVTQYGVMSIPFNVLVGRDGKIIGKDLHGEELEAAVAAALAK